MAKNDTEYVVYMERRREALISNQPVCESDTVDRKPIVSEHYYHDVFVNEFNIHFGFRFDTCDTCDSLMLRIDAEETDEGKAELEEELESHIKLVEQGYASLCKDSQKCKESWSHTR